MDLFFVLSGFLITMLLLVERRDTGRVSFAAFYRRRGYRLMPALLVMLVVFAVISLATGGLDAHEGLGLLGGLTYLTNVFGMHGGSDGFTALPFETRPLWSLAQEEQFYLLWPPLLFIALRGRVKVAVAGLGILLLVSVAQGWRLAGAGDRVLFGPDTRAVGILVGCLAALALFSAPGVARTCRSLTLPSLLLVLVYISVPQLHETALMFRGGVLVFSVICAVAIVGAYEGGALVARWLSARPVVYLGRISYSLYVWHALIIVSLLKLDVASDAAARATGVVLAIVAASASYHLVELPFLRRRPRPVARDVTRPPHAVPAPGAAVLASSATAIRATN